MEWDETIRWSIVSGVGVGEGGREWSIKGAVERGKRGWWAGR